MSRHSAENYLSLVCWLHPFEMAHYLLMCQQFIVVHMLKVPEN